MVFLQKMQQMFSEKKYKELKEFCKAELDLRPDDVDLLFFYASAIEALGENRAAKNAFEKLFRLTKDKLFLVCESIPAFREGLREEAEKELEEVEREEKDVNKLFFAFKVAVNNGELEIGRRVFYKCITLDAKKTSELLQAYYESLHANSIEKRMFFVSVLELLKDVSKIYP
jgi:tetratricopeptide (TPR) repeat protein